MTPKSNFAIFAMCCAVLFVSAFGISQLFDSSQEVPVTLSMTTPRDEGPIVLECATDPICKDSRYNSELTTGEIQMTACPQEQIQSSDPLANPLPGYQGQFQVVDPGLNGCLIPSQDVADIIRTAGEAGDCDAIELYHDQNRQNFRNHLTMLAQAKDGVFHGRYPVYDGNNQEAINSIYQWAAINEVFLTMTVQALNRFCGTNLEQPDMWTFGRELQMSGYVDSNGYRLEEQPVAPIPSTTVPENLGPQA